VVVHVPPGPPPPPAYIPTTALALDVGSFVAIRASLQAGTADARAAFECSLEPPFEHAGFIVFAGLEPLLESLERFRPKSDDLAWLYSVGAIDGPTRERLASMRFACDVEAAPEGSVVFPGEPVLAIEGPFWQAQMMAGLVQSALSEPSLVATKTMRCSLAAEGGEVIEASAVIAHRLGGNPLLARAAFVGGADATTCTLAARRFGIPLRAMQPLHSVLASASETAAYETWLDAAPDLAVLRVDAKDALAGGARVIAAIKKRPKKSTWHALQVAIELGSGDRAELATELTRAFVASGVRAPVVAASGDLDEWKISELRRRQAPVTSFILGPYTLQLPAPPARYDLVAIEEDGDWVPRVRLGSTLFSSSDPGRKVLLRYFDEDGRPLGDLSHAMNERLVGARDLKIIDRATGFVTRLPSATSSAPLLTKVMRGGKRVARPESVFETRERARKAVTSLFDRYRRLTSPRHFPVGMTQALTTLKADLVAASA
jgi:nicotinate phosphoribosyltransferase